jgi:carbonic anhydrase
MEGNKRFAFSDRLQGDVAALTKGQQAYATILGCADSRVPPQLIFDANLGELFIVRLFAA